MPIKCSITATPQTVTTSEGQPIDIVFSGEGEGLTVLTKAVIEKLPDNRKGSLAQMPDLKTINGAGAVVKHAERKA